jgi:arginine decarboxylase
VSGFAAAGRPGSAAAKNSRPVPHTRRVIMSTPDPDDARDPLGLAADAPMLAAWLNWMRQAESGRLMPMSTPGHKQRYDLVGTVVAGDAPLYGALDAIKHADRLRTDAETRAAALWGADWCRFSVAGSTHGNQAFCLAIGQPGQEVVITRTLHRSLLLGLVMAGLRPVWVRPEIDPGTGLPGAVAVRTVRDALAAHPDACGVIMGDPSYVGTTGDLAGHARAAHDAGVPLIVDQAWAAYLGFHPDLPAHAIAAGADAMVTSAHKTLPAYTQGAVVLARTERLDRARLERAFDATHTTSPAGSILASIDAARALLARDGERLCGRLLRGLAAARQRLREVPGLDVLDGPGVDPAKLVVLLAGTGAHGGLVEADLIAAGMPVEMGDRDTVVPIVTIADDEEQIAKFTEELIAAVDRHRGEPRRPVPTASWTVRPETVLAPRDAFFAPNETVLASAATGRISAELVAPYPPGVPVLAPGELITEQALAALREVAGYGGRIAYAEDPSLATFQVVAGWTCRSEPRLYA